LNKKFLLNALEESKTEIGKFEIDESYFGARRVREANDAAARQAKRWSLGF
jgi:hypothetical protein